MRKAILLSVSVIFIIFGCSSEDSKAFKSELFIDNEIEFIPDQNTSNQENASTIEGFDQNQGNKFRAFQFIQNIESTDENIKLFFKVEIPSDGRVTYLYTFFQPREDREITGYFEWNGLRYNLYSGRIGINNRGNNDFIIDLDIRGAITSQPDVYISGRIEGKLSDLTL